VSVNVAVDDVEVVRVDVEVVVFVLETVSVVEV